MIRILVLITVALCMMTGCHGHSTGAVFHPLVCNNLTPNHGFEVQNGRGKYSIEAVRSGQQIAVTLSGSPSNPTFKGFVIRFIPTNAGHFISGNTFKCEFDADTVTHSDPSDKASHTVTFQINPGFENTKIGFKATVVQEYTNIFGLLHAEA